MIFYSVSKMQKQNMDLYIPRKFSATNRLITSKDHASVQIYFCSFIRAQNSKSSPILVKAFRDRTLSLLDLDEQLCMFEIANEIRLDR
ncbi:hypothetical protein ACS0TY_025339 [Phlomoides rotata]